MALYFLAFLHLFFIYHYCGEENESEREGEAFNTFNNMNTPLSHTAAEKKRKEGKEKMREYVVVIPTFSGIKLLLHTPILPSFLLSS